MSCLGRPLNIPLRGLNEVPLVILHEVSQEHQTIDLSSLVLLLCERHIPPQFLQGFLMRQKMPLVSVNDPQSQGY